MSHFSVAVFTDNSKPLDTIDRALQPFHEFECTGTDDEFVQDIDITREALDLYVSPKQTKSMVRFADGSFMGAYEPSLWRALTDDEQLDLGTKGFLDDRHLSDGRLVLKDNWGTETYHPRVADYPEGSVAVGVQVSEIMTFVEFVDYYYGYKILDVADAEDTKYGYAVLNDAGNVVKVVKRMNPSSHWDWHTIGGRYSERLFVKSEITGVLLKGERSWGMEDKPDTGGLDSALLIDLDWDKMVADKIDERRRWFNEYYPAYQEQLNTATDSGDVQAITAVHQRADMLWGGVGMQRRCRPKPTMLVPRCR